MLPPLKPPGTPCPMFCAWTWEKITERRGLSEGDLKASRCVLEGQTDKEIAKTLDIKEATAGWRMSRLFRAFVVSTRSGLVAKVHEDHEAILDQNGPPPGCNRTTIKGQYE